MSGRGEAGFPTRTAVEQRHLPGVSRLVMTQDVDATVIAAQLEVAVDRVQPTVDDLADLDGAPTDEEAQRGDFRAVTGVTLDADRGRFISSCVCSPICEASLFIRSSSLPGQAGRQMPITPDSGIIPLLGPMVGVIRMAVA
jgi:hypothetical protein